MVLEIDLNIKNFNFSIKSGKNGKIAWIRPPWYWAEEKRWAKTTMIFGFSTQKIANLDPELLRISKKVNLSPPPLRSDYGRLRQIP